MEALNLSAAIEAGARADEADTSIGTSEQHAERIITAALPHILDALAEDAQNEADRKRISVYGQMQPHYMDSYARWLRAKAGEVRE